MFTIDKIRLDMLVIARGLAVSREKAKEYITSGKIFSGGKCITKCGLKVDPDIELEMRGEAIPFVSRAGLKLEKALNDFNIILDGFTCVDVGASTGGFTECMLQRGASKVFAIDVGRDQLAEKLRSDNRVISMEGTNIKAVTPQMLGESCDFVSIDVSFISLTKVIPYVAPLLKEDGRGVALIKPQFEAGRGAVSKKGVVKSKKTHAEVIKSVLDMIMEVGLSVVGLDFSGIKGQNGNIEYLVYFAKELKDGEKGLMAGDINSVINRAHEMLNLEDI